jgi:hypothetical protein
VRRQPHRELLRRGRARDEDVIDQCAAIDDA